jgi:mono/diheme cytochrome c family protein
LLAGCDSLPGKPTEEERPLRPAQVVDFNTLYGTNCAGCHGDNGTLGAARPLNDAIYLSVVGLERLRQITADGVPNSLMPGFGITAGGSLTDDQVDIVVKGIIRRWAGADPLNGVAHPAYAAPPGDAQRATAPYTTYCAGCHGSDGRGAAKGGSIVDAAYLGLVSDQALRTAVICGRPDLGMPDWRSGAAGAMSDRMSPMWWRGWSRNGDDDVPYRHRWARAASKAPIMAFPRCAGEGIFGVI